MTSVEHIPPANREEYRAMKLDPSVSYIITCAFLFYVFMCAGLLENLVGYNLRRYINTHEYIKHALGLVVLIFTIGVVTSIRNLWVVILAGILVYVWFLAMTKMPGQWNMLILLLLMICFVMNGVLVRVYTPDWAYATDDQEVTARRVVERQRLIYGMYGVGLITLFLSLWFLWWFHSKTRTDAVKAYNAKIDKIFKTQSGFRDVYHWAHSSGGMDKWRREQNADNKHKLWGALQEWVYQPYSNFIEWNGMLQSSVTAAYLTEDDLPRIQESILKNEKWLADLADRVRAGLT